MFYRNCVLIIVLSLSIDGSYSVLAEKSKFETFKPSSISSLPDERRLINFKERSEDTPKKREQSDDRSEKIQDSRQENKIRTFTASLADNGDNNQCCESRYEVGSPVRPETSHGRKDGGLKDSSDNGRYPSRYGSHPEDRFGWHSYNPGNPGRRGITFSSAASASGSASSSEGLYGSYSGGDRYGGTKPPYYGGDNEYDRPGTSGSRPGRPIYGYGGSGRPENGGHGSNGYEASRPGVFGGAGRPPGGFHFSGGGRPGIGSYGGGGYGGGGHGVYGTIGEEAEFPGQTDGAEGGPPHPGVSNLQTQKAVALKALAGVALIGAAAALATNPVLLPIGVLAGRRKRSVDSKFQAMDFNDEELTKLLDDNLHKFYRGKMTKRVLDSATCIARLVCEIRGEYGTERRKKNIDDKTKTNARKNLRRLEILLRSNIHRSDDDHKNVKKLIRSIEEYDGSCNAFVCDFTEN